MPPASPPVAPAAALGKGDLLLRGLVVLPPLALLVILFVYRGWNIVWGDDVAMCPIFDDFYRSTLSFGELWESYAGHRIFFPRVLALALGYPTHWNVYMEIGFVYVAAVYDFALLCWLLQPPRMTLSGRVRLGLAVLFSLSIFSANQVEMWSNGTMICLALSIACVLTGIALLTRFGAGFGTLALAILLGTVATYSNGNGLTYWPALVPLLYAELRDDPRWPIKAGLWTAASAVVVFFYFRGLTNYGISVPMTRNVLNILSMPGVFCRYLLTCSGAGVLLLNGAKANLSPALHTLVSSGAPVCGLAGLTAGGWALWRVLRRDGPGLAVVAPWLAIGGYGLLSVLEAAVARYSSAPESAISSRYIGFGQYMWLALFVLLALLLPRLRRSWLWTGGAVLAACYLISYGNGVRRDRQISADLRQIREGLLGQPTAETYRLINPGRPPEQVASCMEILREHRLAVFHDAPPRP